MDLNLGRITIIIKKNNIVTADSHRGHLQKDPVAWLFHHRGDEDG